MTKFIVLSVIVLFLFSCKKKDDPIPTPDPTAIRPPTIIHYNTINQTAYLENAVAGDSLIGYAGKYCIKYRLSYMGDSGKYVVWHAFLQKDSGVIYLRGGFSTAYAVIVSDHYIAGWLLNFKFRKGENDFSVTPGIVTDTTTVISITALANSRQIEVSGKEFRNQGYVYLWYDR